MDWRTYNMSVSGNLPTGEIENGYRLRLRELQIELVKFQRHLIKYEARVLVLLEGRDAAGKDGVIKRIVEHLSPRDTRVVALSAPSNREQTEWYFQRYVEHLPAAAEFVLFNRSWYNRAGVERVMGFCTVGEVENFFEDAPVFERMLVNSGIRLFKYYLDIDRDEQKQRLKERRLYTGARDDMLRRTHTPHAPWHIVRANSKHEARLQPDPPFTGAVAVPRKGPSALGL